MSSPAQPGANDDEPSAVAQALRQAVQFDRSAVSLRAGLVAAIPVVGVLAAGTLAHDTVAAVTMGAGAMLVGIAWRAGGGRPPLATMATDTAVMGLSTFAGAASGRVAWLHLALLAVWALAAGLIVAVGRRSAIVGTQAIIAFVVFGRFSQPIPGAAGLAGLVLAGGVAQVVFSALFGAPPALRVQRSAVAEAYRSVAALALDAVAPSAPAAAALDEADQKLASPTLLGDAAMMTLSALVQEGRRIRLEFLALSLLRVQYARDHPATKTALRGATDRLRERAADALRCIADVVEGPAAADRLEPAMEALSLAVDSLTETVESAGPGAQIADRLEHHTVALAGQIRAAAGFAAGVHERPGRMAVRPSLGSAHPWDQLLADLAQIRANASLRSPAGRHAVRLAVIIPATALLAEHLPLQRSYWIVVAVATVLRPDFGATFTRAAERMAGTLIGVALAGLVAVALHPSGWATVALVGVLAWVAYSVFPASFAAGIVFLNAMIVFLLEAVSPSTATTATDRGIDTLVGGTIALIAYALWPTWSRVPARQALARLVTAQREYVRAVLATVADGRAGDEEELRPFARGARMAWTNAEATVERSLTEPATRRIDVEQARGVMTGLRRLVQASHVIRLEPGAHPDDRPLAALRPLAAALDRTLAIIAETVATGTPAGTSLPPLRALHRELADGAAGEVPNPLLLTELDEIVDAANTVAGLLGLGTADDGKKVARRGGRTTAGRHFGPTGGA
jgi:uncharacterized membrane protein YccC